ncbi:MAG: DegT/DnrJ/EryC1/StrS family aminotransferase [Ruminococcus sp.]|jgi:dTDP-4-amino-4,6-dideoxygalactose transaminase|nr:DegT/DnrJ/EryC1/StrS family aminotransferase [Ruminococcus sp.]
MNVPFVSFEKMHGEIREEMYKKFQEVYERNWFIQGDESELFEKEFAEYHGAAECVGVGNGLDALFLSLKALGIGEGDEVIIPGNTFIATALAVTYTGAVPVFVEPDMVTYNMGGHGLEEAYTEKTKAVIPVHLYGQPADMDAVLEFAARHQLYVLEDCAQAHGAVYKGKRTGTFGDIGCFSFYPGKNLGALGDGGAVITDDLEIARKVRALGNYGFRKKYECQYLGNNSRLDELQAAFLRIKLKHLDRYNAYRNKVAGRYLREIVNPKIILPQIGPDRTHVWHIFAVLCEERDRLQTYLADHGVMTVCHYPIPIYEQEAYRSLALTELPFTKQISSQELSLPMYYGITEEEVGYVVRLLNEF